MTQETATETPAKVFVGDVAQVAVDVSAQGVHGSPTASLEQVDDARPQPSAATGHQERQDRIRRTAGIGVVARGGVIDWLKVEARCGSDPIAHGEHDRSAHQVRCTVEVGAPHLPLGPDRVPVLR